MGLITSTSALTAPENFCLMCVRSLEQHPLAPSKFTKKTATLDAINSPANMAPWEIVDCIQPAKSRPTGGDNLPKIVLQGRTGVADGADTLGDCSAGVCTDGAATTDNQFRLEVVVDKCDHEKFMVSIDDFDALCESPNERIARILREKAYIMKRRKNKDLIDFLYTTAMDYPVSGDSSSGLTTATIPLIATAGNINAAAWAQVLATYREGGFDGELITVGGATLATYGDVKMLSGSTFEDGSRPDPFENAPFVYDRDFDARIQTLQADTDSYGMTIPLGAVGIVHWFENLDYKEISMPDYIQTVIEIDGEEYDYFVNFEKCDTPRWIIMLRQRWAYVVIPEDKYTTGDKPLHLLWKFACGDVDCTNLAAL